MFGDIARRYHEAGISVVPIIPRAKRPEINAWQTYSSRVPSEIEHEGWQRHHWNKGAGIGIVAGSASNLCFIDVDTTVDEEYEFLKKLLPDTPFVKKGAKGFTAAYRWKGGGERAYKIKSRDGRMIVECLSKGNQTVVEGIHPDTGRGYISNCLLSDVLDQLVELPDDFEKQLRDGLKRIGVDVSVGGNSRFAEYVSQGSRDVKMVSICGGLARDVFRGYVKLVGAFDQLKAWDASFVQNVAGDPLDIDKGYAKIVEFIRKGLSKQTRFLLPEGWDEGLSEHDRTRLGIDFGDEQETWGCAKIKEHLTPFMQKGVEDIALESDMMREIYSMADKVAFGMKSDPVGEEMLLKWIVANSGRKFSYASIKKRVNESRNDTIGGKNHTEISTAVIDRIEVDGELRYWGSKFWQWNGSHWEPFCENRVLSLVSSEFGHLPAAAKASDHRGITSVVKSNKFRESFERSDEGRYGVNFANGFLKVDGELVPHDPKLGSTYVMPFRYLPEKAKEAVKWVEFLEDTWSEDHVLEKQAKIAGLQEAMCASMMGLAVKFQRAILLYGAAFSGKSVILKVLEGMFPECVRSSTPPEKWGDKFSITQLSTALINIAGELPSGGRQIPGSAFKMVIDGHSMEGQYKGTNIFNFTPRAGHWFGTNSLPRCDDKSDGFLRRWLIFKFDRVLPVERRVLAYDEVLLEEEREAIVAWIMEALPRITSQKDYTCGETHKLCIEQMAEENSEVLLFLRNSGKIKLERGASVPLDDVYNEFSCYQYANANGKAKYSASRFRNEMNGLMGRLSFVIARDVNDRVMINGMRISR